MPVGSDVYVSGWGGIGLVDIARRFGVCMAHYLSAL